VANCLATFAGQHAHTCMHVALCARRSPGAVVRRGWPVGTGFEYEAEMSLQIIVVLF
jgi:hypothetical protein